MSEYFLRFYLYLSAILPVSRDGRLLVTVGRHVALLPAQNCRRTSQSLTSEYTPRGK